MTHVDYTYVRESACALRCVSAIIINSVHSRQ